MNASDKKILSVVLGFFTGIVLHSYVSVSLSVVFLFLILCGSFFLVHILEKNKTFLYGALCFLGIFAGLFRYALSEPSVLGLESYVGQKIVAEGVLFEESDERESSTRLVVTLDTVQDKKIEQKLLAIVPRYPSFQYGDRVTVSGVVLRPEAFESDDGKLFDYPTYLAKDGIFFMMKNGSAEKVSSGNGWWLQEKLFALKNGFVASFERVLGEPHASLLAGLLVGDKRSLGESVTEDFQRAGLIHIIVLSGYNITIVAENIMKLFSFLPGAFSSGFGVVGILFFALMTGASSTVVRASLMALIALFARQIGRLYDITRALIFAALIMVLFNPKLLVFDMSFELSFLSTMGLIYFSPITVKYLGKIPEKGGLREIVSATISTQIFVLPFLLTKIGQVSVISLFSNILVLPIIPATMFIGFITGLVGFVSPFVAIPFGFVAHLALSWILFISHLFASLPFSQVTIPFFPWWLALVCYISFAYIFWKKYPKEKAPSAVGVSPVELTTF